MILDGCLYSDNDGHIEQYEESHQSHGDHDNNKVKASDLVVSFLGCLLLGSLVCVPFRILRC
jgi:hypothetical protein